MLCDPVSNPATAMQAISQQRRPVLVPVWCSGNNAANYICWAVGSIPAMGTILLLFFVAWWCSQRHGWILTFKLVFFLLLQGFFSHDGSCFCGPLVGSIRPLAGNNVVDSAPRTRICTRNSSSTGLNGNPQRLGWNTTITCLDKCIWDLPNSCPQNVFPLSTSYHAHSDFSYYSLPGKSIHKQVGMGQVSNYYYSVSFLL